MNTKGISKSFFALALATGLVVQGLNPVFADGGNDNGSGSNQSHSLHDNTHLGEVDGVDTDGLTVHIPSVFDTYIPGKIANSGGRPPLAYRGGITANGITGGVSKAPKVYVIFWGSQWGTTGTVRDNAGNDRLTFSNDPKGMAPYVQSMIAGLGTSNETWSTVMAQYCDGVAVGATTCAGNAAAKMVGYPTGGALADVWYDNSVVAPTTASQLQIAAEAKAAALHFGNLTPVSNASTQYVVVSATGMHPNGFNTTAANWCAWHDYAADLTVGNYAYTNLPYIPDMGASCGANYVNGTDGALDGVGIVEGHEYAETVTDQWPAGGWTDSVGYENGDDCSWTGPTGGQGGNLVLATGTFAMQGTWSNADNNCSMGSVHVIGSGLPTAKTGAAYATTAVSGGFTNYTYSAVGGALPAGLALGADGRITGTVSAAAPVGIYTQAVTVTDSKGATTSGTININVALAVVTSTSVVASASSGTTATPITLTATVLPATAGQSVSFKDGTTVLGSAITDATGLATLAARTFTGGSHSITASFAGSGVYLASTSPAVVISIAAAVSSLALTTNVSTGINPSTSVTMTATLSPVISSATITFYDGATSLGTARTSASGVATLAKAFAAGNHTLTASYAGSTAATASTSSAVALTSTIMAPGAPTSPRLTASTTAGTATATWTAPSSTGGSAITSYTVYIYQGSTLVKSVAGPTTRTVTITGLTSKAVLNIKVSATNIAGEGPQSVASATATIK
jgi:serine protease